MEYSNGMIYVNREDLTAELINELIEKGERFYVYDDESEIYTGKSNDYNEADCLWGF